jgi:DNA-binding LytR/AlgR family response regulator
MPLASASIMPLANASIMPLANASIKTFVSAESFLFESEPFDILLLDIQMGGKNGLELAKELRNSDRHTQIIFITAYSDFLADGYDVDAVNYLLKPVGEDRFFGAMDKAFSRLSKSEPSLLISSGGETLRIPAGEIISIESFSHMQEITATSGVYSVKTPFYTLERKLGDGFVRTHRSYIVGVRHIKKVTKGEVVMMNGKSVPLSRRLYESVNKALIRYFRRESE